VRYTGVDGNRPKSYDNSVTLWDTWSPIVAGPHKTPPLRVVPIRCDLQPNTTYVPWPFTGTDYLITYQVGESLTTMCAGVRFSLKIKPMAVPPLAVSMSVYKLDDASITIVYSTMGGYLPKTYGNWVGVWQGFAGPYFPPRPDSWAPVPSDRTQDLVTVSKLQILPDFTYRIIYFMGPNADGIPGPNADGTPEPNVGATLTFIAKESGASAVVDAESAERLRLVDRRSPVRSTPRRPEGRRPDNLRSRA
jgi:hypothetical protein